MSTYKYNRRNKSVEPLSERDRQHLKANVTPAGARIKAARDRNIRALNEDLGRLGPHQYDYEYDDLQTMRKAALHYKPNVPAPWEGKSSF